MDANRIASKLWLGGQPKACGPFDVVVLCAMELQHIRLPCRVIHAPLDDAVPTRDEVFRALRAADAVNDFRRLGKRVLVTCAQGLNRSALVTALALMRGDGLRADEAIDLVRDRRKHRLGLRALSNPHFVKLLHRAEKAMAA